MGSNLERQSCGVRGFATPPRFWAGESWGLRLGPGRVVKYYILSCTGSMFESGDF